MGDDIKEECGVAAIYMKNSEKATTAVPELLITELFAQQHRGQKSAGISIYNPFFDKLKGESILNGHKGLGLVSEVFHMSNPTEAKNLTGKLAGIAGIGHVRYSTAGSGRLSENRLVDQNEVQPFERRHGRPSKRFSIGFNGNFANDQELRREIKKDHDYIFDTIVDTETLMHLVALTIKRLSGNESHPFVKPSHFEVIKEMMKVIDGSYSVVSLFADGDLVAFRDPRGFMPLVWDENEDYIAIASESTALKKIGLNNYRDIERGTGIIVNKEGVQISGKLGEAGRSFCQFNAVYFEKGDSKNDGIWVRGVRKKGGTILARTDPLLNYFLENKDRVIVVPSAYTGFPIGEAYAQESKLPLSLSLEKVSGVGRGFINTPEIRSAIMDLGYIIHEDVNDKIVVFTDDSLVRGETSKRNIRQFKEAGAVEVHVRCMEPHIKHPCFYGIDFPTRAELAANKVGTNGEDIDKRIANYIGADSFHALSIDQLVQAIGIPRNELCLACLTGEYPTKYGEIRAREAK